MKDGHRISEQAKSILSAQPGIRIRVATSAPVCSKTRQYLQDMDIEIIGLRSLSFPS